MTEKREFRAAALGAGIVACYMAMVLASGHVDAGMFARLLAFYVKTASALWLFVLGFAVLSRMVIESRKTGDQPFLASFLVNSLRQRWHDLVEVRRSDETRGMKLQANHRATRVVWNARYRSC